MVRTRRQVVLATHDSRLAADILARYAASHHQNFSAPGETMQRLGEQLGTISRNLAKWDAPRRAMLKLRQLHPQQRIAREATNALGAAVFKRNTNDGNVGLLLRRGADPNHVVNPETGQTALIWASRKGFKNIVKLLLAHGAKVDTRDKDGWTALLEASHAGHDLVVGMLLKAGAKVDQTSYGMTALMYAISGRHVPVIKRLVDAGADVRKADLQGVTPLMMSYKMPEVIRLLISKGADPRATDRVGRTALMHAIFGYGTNIESIYILLEALKKRYRTASAFQGHLRRKNSITKRTARNWAQYSFGGGNRNALLKLLNS